MNSFTSVGPFIFLLKEQVAKLTMRIWARSKHSNLMGLGRQSKMLPLRTYQNLIIAPAAYLLPWHHTDLVS